MSLEAIHIVIKISNLILECLVSSVNSVEFSNLEYKNIGFTVNREYYKCRKAVRLKG